MRRVAIIPARGGSKRIPRKNIKNFLGKPIIAYSIEAALNSQLFDEVIVSTDDKEIKVIAESFGANVPFLRSKKNSDDYATTVDVLLEVHKNLIIADKKYDFGTCIYPTAPFVNVKILKESIQLLENDDTCDCVLPVVPFSYPIQRALSKDANGNIFMANSKNIFTRSQDLEKMFHDAGQFYSFDWRRLLERKSLLTDSTKGIEVSELQVQDIDTEIDWQLAELKYELQSSK